MKKLNLKSVEAHKVPRGFKNEVRHEEVFESTGRQTSKVDAESVLASIRREHSAEYGWVEIAAEVTPNPNGKHWDVRRHHVQLQKA
jgi:hypothetical protein